MAEPERNNKNISSVQAIEEAPRASVPIFLHWKDHGLGDTLLLAAGSFVVAGLICGWLGNLIFDGEGLLLGVMISFFVVLRLLFYSMPIEDNLHELSVPRTTSWHLIFLAILLFPFAVYLFASFLVYLLLYILLWLPFYFFSLCDDKFDFGVVPFRLWRRSLTTSLLFPIVAPGFYLFDFGVMLLLSVLALGLCMGRRLAEFFVKSIRIIWRELVKAIDSIGELFATIAMMQTLD